MTDSCREIQAASLTFDMRRMPVRWPMNTSFPALFASSFEPFRVFHVVFFQAKRDAELRFLSSLEESKWLLHAQLTLEAAVMCAEKLHLEGASVVLHCSDGWDRTAQVCCGVQPPNRIRQLLCTCVFVFGLLLHGYYSSMCTFG